MSTKRKGGNDTIQIKRKTKIISRKIKDYFTGCLPWPQKGTASFINDIGNLAVESVPQYPFGHTIKVVADSGYNSYYETSAGSHDDESGQLHT
jgi:hypothetical protein